MAKRSGGVSFVGLLTILFVGLKLTGYIAWSWWWVLSPLWISILLLITIVATVLGFTWYIADKVDVKVKKQSRRL